MTHRTLFATPLFQAALSTQNPTIDAGELEASCLAIAEDDEATAAPVDDDDDAELGDIFGTGTISGPDDSALGSLLEISAGGRRTVALASGESRRFLEDGDHPIPVDLHLKGRHAQDEVVGLAGGEFRQTVA